MKNIVRICLLSVAIVVIIQGCTNQNAINSTSTPNLIQNPSFESGDSASLQYWIMGPYSDTSLVHFSTDVPPGGGKYSLKLSPGWIPSEGAVFTGVAISPGTHVYRFSVWAKTIPANNQSYFSVIYSGFGDTSAELQRVYIDDSTWKLYTVADTISASQGDWISIMLSAGRTEVANWAAYFDMCDLTQLQ